MGGRHYVDVFFLPKRWPETATNYTWPMYLRAHMHGNRRCSVWFVTGQTVPPRFPSFRDTSLRHASDDTATTTSSSIRATASGLASSGEREFLRNCGDELVRLMEHLKIQCDKIYAMTHRGLSLSYWNSYSESKIVAKFYGIT